MSAINIPEAKDGLEPNQCTIRNILIENGQLIETAAEYQRMGKIKESIKYQKLLHQNLINITRLADLHYGSQIIQEIGPPQISKSVANESNYTAENILPSEQVKTASSQISQHQLLIPATNVTQQFSPTHAKQQSISPQHIQQRASSSTYTATSYSATHQPQQMTPQQPHPMAYVHGVHYTTQQGYMPQQPPATIPLYSHAQVHYSQPHYLADGADQHNQTQHGRTG